MKENSIHKVANTIVANLDNTGGCGLISGKMGLSIFLYLYSRSYDKPSYRDIADRLIMEIYNCDHSHLPFNVQDGLAGIGIGLSFLVSRGVWEGNTDEILEDIDDMMLENISKCIKQDILYCSDYFSLGMYILCRIKTGEFKRMQDFIKQLALKLDSLLRTTSLSEKNINLLKSIKSTIDSIASIEGETNADLTSLSVNVANMLRDKRMCKDNEYKYSHESILTRLWEGFLLDRENDIDDIESESVIESLIEQYPYRMDSINNELAILGINILK